MKARSSPAQAGAQSRRNFWTPASAGVQAES